MWMIVMLVLCVQTLLEAIPASAIVDSQEMEGVVQVCHATFFCLDYDKPGTLAAAVKYMSS